MLDGGSLAIALVKRKVTVVQASRNHTLRDRYLDVNVYSLFGGRVFLANDVPGARIASTDILMIFPASDAVVSPAPGMVELPQQAFYDFKELSSRYQRKYEGLWNAWTATC